MDDRARSFVVYRLRIVQGLSHCSVVICRGLPIFQRQSHIFLLQAIHTPSKKDEMSIYWSLAKKWQTCKIGRALKRYTGAHLYFS
jgi:hypothetical protein